MSEVVFILGAGASRQGGAPLMHDFLDVADRLLRTGRAGSDLQRKAFDLVFRGVAALQPAFAKAVIDSDNLESVFAAFEMAELFGSLPPLKTEEVGHLTAALRTLIVRTLEHELIYQVVGTGMAPRVVAPKPYDSFGDLLAELHRDPYRTVSVMTFNYDLALDVCLLGTPINYCLLERAPERSADLEIMKLHGSLNWRRCEGCKQVVTWDLQKFLESYMPEQFVKGSTRLEVGQRLTGFVHCRDQPPPHTAEPVIVPPTWSKAGQYEAIQNVWRRAAWHFAEAREIFVIGYSMPETDQFFRYLYALGTVSPVRLQRFWVVDPDPHSRVAKRFKRLLGPLARQRFEHIPKEFNMALGEIQKALRK